MTLSEGIGASYLALGLSDEQLGRIADIGEDVSFADGEVVVKQFDRETDLYVLLEGKVLIETHQNELIARVRAGGIFGEISLIDERPRSATVTCHGPCRLARIPAAGLRKLMVEHPGIGVVLLTNLSRLLCERLRSANLQMEALFLALE
jgi:CRP-like cAMP-binding protein